MPRPQVPGPSVKAQKHPHVRRPRVFTSPRSVASLVWFAHPRVPPCHPQGLLQNVYLVFENSVEDVLSRKGCPQSQGGRCVLNNIPRPGWISARVRVRARMRARGIYSIRTDATLTDRAVCGEAGQGQATEEGNSVEEGGELSEHVQNV